MALIDILRDISGLMGVDITDVSQKALLIQKVNKAANEVYSYTDIPKCLREQVFCIDQEERQLTLPYYVYKVRGIRNYDNPTRITVNDMRPRYFKGPQATYQNILSWREKEDMIIGKNLTNASALTITPTAAATAAFTVTVVGSTVGGSRVSETVQFSVDDTSKTTVNAFSPFPGLVNIQKNILIDQDISITDASGNEISFIANSEYRPYYTLLQSLDNNFAIAPLLSDCYEILYKIRMTPFRNDFDVFPVENFDDIIGWKTLSQYYSTLMDDKSKQNALDYETRLAEAMAKRIADAENADEKEIQFAENRFFEAVRNCSPNYISLWR